MVTPTPPMPPGQRFFEGNRRPDQVLVAAVDGVVAGYVRLGNPTGLDSSRHVVEIQGLAVDPAHAGQGIGGQLLAAAVGEATARGARRLTLRVLGENAVARRLYERSGFHVEGLLGAEFFLDGRYVDDVLMAIKLV